MTFTTTKLVDERVLVRGTDVFGTSGSTVLDSSQWSEVNSRKEFSQATDEFDKAVADFFKPLTEAAEKVNKKIEKQPDALSYVVLSEATEGVQAKPAQLIKLTKDSIILRIIEQGNTDRLAWVADELEVLAVEDVPVGLVPSASEVTQMGAEATGIPLED
jgi:hypothetical protein